MTQTKQMENNIYTVELASDLRLRQWPQEAEAVVFNSASGNTFEINPAAVRLIIELKQGPLTLSQALDVAGVEYPQHDRHLQESRFLRDYLLPMNQLDLLRIQSS